LGGKYHFDRGHLLQLRSAQEVLRLFSRLLWLQYYFSNSRRPLVNYPCHLGTKSREQIDIPSSLGYLYRIDSNILSLLLRYLFILAILLVASLCFLKECCYLSND